MILWRTHEYVPQRLLSKHSYFGFTEENYGQKVWYLCFFNSVSIFKQKCLCAWNRCYLVHIDKKISGNTVKDSKLFFMTRTWDQCNKFYWSLRFDVYLSTSTSDRANLEILILGHQSDIRLTIQQFVPNMGLQKHYVYRIGNKCLSLWVVHDSWYYFYHWEYYNDNFTGFCSCGTAFAFLTVRYTNV